MQACPPLCSAPLCFNSLTVARRPRSAPGQRGGPSGRGPSRSSSPASRRARTPPRPAPFEAARQVPASLEYSLARTRKFPFFADEPEAFFPSLDALLSSLGAPAPVAPAKPEGPPALHAPATSAPAGGAAPSAPDAVRESSRWRVCPKDLTRGRCPAQARAGALQAEIAGSDRELEQARAPPPAPRGARPLSLSERDRAQLEREIAELEAAAARG
eukprot:tig00021116_g18417.t1